MKHEYEIYPPQHHNYDEDNKQKSFFLHEIKVGGYGFSRRQLFLFGAINLALVSLALNFILTPDALWFIPLTALVMTAMLIIYAISDRRSVLRNIRRVVSIWCVGFLLMQYFLFRGNWAVDFAIPITILCFYSYLGGMLFKSKIKLSATLFSVSLIAAHTVYPLILLNLGYTGGTLAAKTLVYTAFILSLVIIANLGLFWFFSLKTKIKKTLQ